MIVLKIFFLWSTGIDFKFEKSIVFFLEFVKSKLFVSGDVGLKVKKCKNFHFKTNPSRPIIFGSPLASFLTVVN